MFLLFAVSLNNLFIENICTMSKMRRMNWFAVESFRHILFLFPFLFSSSKDPFELNFEHSTFHYITTCKPLYFVVTSEPIHYVTCLLFVFFFLVLYPSTTYKSNMWRRPCKIFTHEKLRKLSIPSAQTKCSLWFLNTFCVRWIWIS